MASPGRRVACIPRTDTRTKHKCGANLPCLPYEKSLLSYSVNTCVSIVGGKLKDVHFLHPRERKTITYCIWYGSGCTYDIVIRVLRLRRNTHWQKYASLGSLLPVLAKGILGKGRLGYRALLPELQQVILINSLLVAVWRTARHWPDTRVLFPGHKKAPLPK